MAPARIWAHIRRMGGGNGFDG